MQQIQRIDPGTGGSRPKPIGEMAGRPLKKSFSPPLAPKPSGLDTVFAAFGNVMRGGMPPQDPVRIPEHLRAEPLPETTVGQLVGWELDPYAPQRPEHGFQAGGAHGQHALASAAHNAAAAVADFFGFGGARDRERARANLNAAEANPYEAPSSQSHPFQWLAWKAGDTLVQEGVPMAIGGAAGQLARGGAALMRVGVPAVLESAPSAAVATGETYDNLLNAGMSPSDASGSALFIGPVSELSDKTANYVLAGPVPLLPNTGQALRAVQDAAVGTAAAHAVQKSLEQIVTPAGKAPQKK